MNPLRKLYKMILQDYEMDYKRISLWIAEGDPKQSEVVFNEIDKKFDYELIFYINRDKKVNYSIFFHELAHIIFIESLAKEKGMPFVLECLNKYNQSVEKLKNDRDRQRKYKQLYLEKEADKLALFLEKKYQKGEVC